MDVFRNFTKILLATFSILLIPLCAMALTNEVNWTISDFVLAGILLLAFGLLIDNLYRRLPDKISKMLGIIAALIVFILLWLELAVGIFGSPIGGN